MVFNNFFYFCFIVTCFTYFGQSWAVNLLPDYFPKCSLTDPHLNSCLLNATNKVRRYLVKGVAELKMPSIDPFIIPEINIYDGVGNLTYRVILNDVIFLGLSKYKFSKLDFDASTLTLEAELTIPDVDFAGDYEIIANIFSLPPLLVDGNFSANVDAIYLQYTQTNQLIKKETDQYMHPIDVNISLDISDMRIRLRGGLFDSISDFGTLTNQAINENLNILFYDMKPAIERTMGNMVKDFMVKHIMKHIPIRNLFSETY